MIGLGSDKNGRSLIHNKKCPKLSVKINRGGKNENDSILPLQSYNLSRPFPLVFYRDRHSTPMTAYYYCSPLDAAESLKERILNYFHESQWLRLNPLFKLF